MLSLSAANVPEHFVDNSDFGVVVGRRFADDATGCEQSFFSEPVAVASSEMFLRSFDERISNSTRMFDMHGDIFAQGIKSFDKVLVKSFCSIELCERCVAESNGVFKIQFFHLMFLLNKKERAIDSTLSFWEIFVLVSDSGYRFLNPAERPNVWGTCFS